MAAVHQCRQTVLDLQGPSSHFSVLLRADVAGLLSRHPEMRTDHSLHYVGPQSNPATSVSLRAIDPERYTIVNEADGTVLEEIEESKAFYEVYDGAVYMYQVGRLIQTCGSKSVAAMWSSLKLSQNAIQVSPAALALCLPSPPGLHAVDFAQYTL